jgi:succinate dehydrogenase/fumarate reductase flavoprotein subunit
MQNYTHRVGRIISVETDLLIIGGGLAGCMAGIKAREQDVDVLIAEKANTLSSGQAGSGIDHIWGYFPPVHEKMGWTLDDLVEDHMQGVACGFAQPELIRFMAGEMYDRLLDLERFGIKVRYEDSPLPGKFRMVYQFHSVPSSLNVDGHSLKVKLTREAKKRGVKIINRIMVTDLLIQEGEICGALGVGTRDANIYIFQAKSVILSAGGKTGRMGRESTGSARFNLHLPGNLSADGKAMALHAGLPIMNMEFLGARRYGLANYETAGRPPGNTWQPAAAIVNAAGEAVVPKSTFPIWGDLHNGYRIDAQETRRQWLAQGGITRQGMPSKKDMQQAGPFFVDCTRGTEEEIRYVEWALSHEGKCNQLLRHLKEEGIDLRKDKLELGLGSREIGNLAASGLVVDRNMETAINGLFAAGDEVGGAPFGASPAAFTTGWRAGEMAGRFASKTRQIHDKINEKVDVLQHVCNTMLGPGDGFTWCEVEDTLQNIMDTYCGDIKTEALLTRGLERVHFIREQPIKVSNAHELARALEVRSLIENAEMIIRASLGRTETRKHPCGFHRADFPEQDDKEWFAFSLISLKNGEYKLSKIPLG